MSDGTRLTADDRFEIHELIARYNRAVDGRDPDGWAATFTPDGEFHSLLVGIHTGADALIAFARSFLVEDRYRVWVGGQHWIGNVVIEGDHDRASVFSYHIMFVPKDDAVAGVLMAAHDDLVVRTADGWRFARRKLVPWPPGSDPRRWDTPRGGTDVES